MNGLEAINHNNGWAIAAIGITIVFTGLVLLSLAISQLHKFIHFWENKDTYFKRWKESIAEKKKQQVAQTVKNTLAPDQLKEIARQFEVLCRSLGQTIPLPELIQRAEKFDLWKPYSSVNHLLEANLLVPDGKGFFSWNQQAYDNIFPKE